MAKRTFRSRDYLRLRVANDPDISFDARRVAFVVTEVDAEGDRLSSSIWVAAVDGSRPPRRFTEGPADSRPRWSPDGRFLAYLSVTDDKAHHAHVRLAPLDGGLSTRPATLPGPISQLAWSPDSRRLAVICSTGIPDPDQLSVTQRNAPRTVRGLAARRDGAGWRDGRRHIFLVDVSDGSTRQLTRGDYDHDDPAFSPDGKTIAFCSDRHPRRDDRQLRAEVWVLPVSGGRPRRLSSGSGHAVAPAYSPDGSLVAFAGKATRAWDADSHVFTVPADASAPAQVLAPATDRPVPVFPGGPRPFSWTGPRELTMLVVDRGGLCLHRARLGEQRSRELVSGDIAVDGMAARPPGRVVAFTADWPDRPSELFVTTTTPSRGKPTRLTHLNDELVAEVELAPVSRSAVVRPDGTQVEYFTLLPPGRRARRLPLHLEIHGGPHGWWPSGWALALHQCLAAAGYAVVLPNPRGSAGYGQQFTSGCTGDWGGADYEDILACCDDLVARGIADSGRMFASGYSYGGFMTGWLAGHSDRFRAATAAAAVIDQTSMALTTDVPDFVRFSMGGSPWYRSGEYEKRSPLFYLPEVDTPLLVLHWEGDVRVPIGQSEELYTGLRLLGKECEFVRYPGGCHVVHTPSQDVDWGERILAWNAKHDRRPAGSRAQRRARSRSGSSAARRG